MLTLCAMRRTICGILVTVVAVGCSSRRHDAASAAAYQNALDAWSRGDQPTAERRLRDAANMHPDDQDIVFFLAACRRSRFEISTADRLFAEAARLDTSTPLATAARAIEQIDSGRDPVEPLRNLRKAAADNPQNPLLIWMLAVECRTLNKPEEGTRSYRRLLTMVHPGSALIHQSFANVLDTQRQYQDALPHRQLAVKLEPAGWSFDGLALTLAAMNRFGDAERAHAKAVALDSHEAGYWRNWGETLLRHGRSRDGLLKLVRAAQLSPDDPRTCYLLGEGLLSSHRGNEALAMYRRAHDLAPEDDTFRKGLAYCLARMGRHSDADQLDPSAAMTVQTEKLPFTAARRHEIFKHIDRLENQLQREAHGTAINPETDARYLALLRNLHLNTMQARSIMAEGAYKRWDIR